MTNKDDKLVKKSQTMTTGVTASKLETGATIDLHGHAVKVTHTDAADTTVQYANLARRTFDTHALNGYLDLGVFPVDTVFERPTAPTERAVIEAVTGSCCYQVRITAGSDAPRHASFTYAEFIGWHMGNNTVQLQALLEDAADDDANPFETELVERVQQLEATPEALQFGDALIADLRAKLEKANKELQQQSIEHDVEKNVLQRELRLTKELITKQQEMHDTVIAGYEEDIARLEAKAAILNPASVRKEVCTLVQTLGPKDRRIDADAELATYLSDNWSTLDLSVVANPDEASIRYVTLVRDLPASPAPKVVATDAAIFSAIPGFRPPVTQPPMPGNQTILNQPVSRALTHNVSRTSGETKRIPSLADLDLQKQRHADEITEIFSRGQRQQEAMRRQFASQPSPFQTGG